ncbi:septation protein SepH [Subtercola boreus]|uniref:septation protein SepH n=1 Tax=Subtercola boreus TaxID=120213 RepID=UPI001559F10F|nr:septation protein SepH [Subtercola boreus]
MNPAPAAHNETADLLEALRRRRGERESASFLSEGDGDDLDSFDDSRSEHPSQHAHAGMFTRGSSGLNSSGSHSPGAQGDTRPVAHLKPGSAEDASAPEVEPESSTSADVPLAGPEETQSTSKQRGAAPARRKSRASMPSWDEIVFGARSDDDLS